MITKDHRDIDELEIMTGKKPNLQRENRPNQNHQKQSQFIHTPENLKNLKVTQDIITANLELQNTPQVILDTDIPVMVIAVLTHRVTQDTVTLDITTANPAPQKPVLEPEHVTIKIKLISYAAEQLTSQLMIPNIVRLLQLIWLHDTDSTIMASTKDGNVTQKHSLQIFKEHVSREVEK